jgi:hypothetical protein
MQVREVPPSLNNAQAIDQMFPRQQLGGSTPTDLAMRHIVDQLIAAQDMGQNIMANPQYIILATDGAPNSICMGGVGGDSAVQQMAVGVEVDRATSRGIKTFVISLAGADAVLQGHLDDIARRGDPTNPMPRTYNPSTPQDLVASLTTLVGSALGCSVE